MGCQIRRQAEHGAAHSLVTFPEAAELIPRLAAANVQLFFDGPTVVLRQTDRQTHTDGQTSHRKSNPPCTRMYTHPFFEATPPGAAPGPPVKNRPVFVTSGGVIIRGPTHTQSVGPR